MGITIDYSTLFFLMWLSKIVLVVLPMGLFLGGLVVFIFHKIAGCMMMWWACVVWFFISLAQVDLLGMIAAAFFAWLFNKWALVFALAPLDPPPSS